MPTPRELVSCVAAALNVPEATVIVHDRNLALAGLRTVAGRGRAVARVTFQDAANLLIAVAASPNVKDSVKTVLDYAELRPIAVVGSCVPESLEDAKNFGEALAAWLEHIALDHDWPSAAIEISGPDPFCGTMYLDTGCELIFGTVLDRLPGLRRCALFNEFVLMPVANLIAAN